MPKRYLDKYFDVYTARGIKEANMAQQYYLVHYRNPEVETIRPKFENVNSFRLSASVILGR